MALACVNLRPPPMGSPQSTAATLPRTNMRSDVSFVVTNAEVVERGRHNALRPPNRFDAEFHAAPSADGACAA
jgi:hypothetical protein